MRLIRSESCTFIWQPKVLMQTVLEAEGASGRASAVALAVGLWESGKGAVDALAGVLVILFLRLVDAGCNRNFTRTALEPEILNLQIPGPRRLPQYIRDAATFLVPKPKDRPSPSIYHLHLPTPRLSSPRVPSRGGLNR